MKDSKNIDILRIKADKISEEQDIVIVEYPFTIFINDKELITLLCSPKSLDFLALGFLFSEGLISSYSDVNRIKIDEGEGIAHVYVDQVNKLNEKLMAKRTITSGGGKGTAFYNLIDSIKSKRIDQAISIDTEKVKDLVGEFSKKSGLFLSTGGAHSCALCDNYKILIFEEDIGRHNALDKIFGKTLYQGMDTRDKMVLSSGRISSEMLIKAANRQIPVVISRAAPTSLAVEMARQLGITLIGFARGDKMNIYSNFGSFNK